MKEHLSSVPALVYNETTKPIIIADKTKIVTSNEMTKNTPNGSRERLDGTIDKTIDQLSDGTVQPNRTCEKALLESKNGADIQKRLMDNTQTSKPRRMPLKDQLYLFFSSITVEPLIALYMIPSALNYLTVQNMDLERACKVNLAYSEEICRDLMETHTGRYLQEEMEVQSLVAQMNVWKTALQSFIPVILIILLGSWSDRTGRRKPIMLLAITGEFVMMLGLLLATYFDHWPMEVAGLIEGVFSAIAGGRMAMRMAVFSYIIDVTSAEQRTFRIGVVKIFVYIGIYIGITSSGLLFQTLGYYGMYTMGAVSYLLGFLYIMFVLKESNQTKIVVVEKSNQFLEFANPKHIVYTLQIITKKREGHRRLIIILMLVAFCLVGGPATGEMSMGYMFTRYKFDWTEVAYSFYHGYTIILNIVGGVITITVLNRMLKLEDTVIGSLSCLGRIFGDFLYGFSKTPAIFCFAHLAEIFIVGGALAIRSIMSKTVGSDEQGKVQAIFGICEAIIPLLFNPLYNFVYVMTIQTFSGALFILGMVITIPGLIIFLWMGRLLKEDRRNEVLKIIHSEA